MAARSFFITLENYTGRDWRRDGLGLSHGEWSDGNTDVPPDDLPKVSLDADGNVIPGVVWFASESDGFATGTEGYADYASEAGKLHVYWDNPYVGSNSFSVTVPDGYTASFSDIHGDNANVTVVVRKH